MKNLSVRTYTSDDFDLWNDFVAKAKNATFLFHRNFMEYHKDRFQDFSLLVFENNKLVGLLPANYNENQLYSHQGLTYGGILVSEDCKLVKHLAILDVVIEFLSTKFEKIHFKILPSIYTKAFSDELLYGLFLHNAKLVRRDTLSVIDLKQNNKISYSRKSEIKKGIAHQIHVRETTDFTQFWNELLVPNLQRKHKVNPVHSLEEITDLHRKFPENIKQFNAYHNDVLIAGATLFITDQVVHVQYISSSDLRTTTGALDFLFDYLIKFYQDKVAYFDFGTSNENQGRTLNEGLLFWKESFGAKTVVQDFYELQLLDR